MATVDICYPAHDSIPDQAREMAAWSLCQKHGVRRTGARYDRAVRLRSIRCELTPDQVEAFRAAAEVGGFMVRENA